MVGLVWYVMLLRGGRGERTAPRLWRTIDDAIQMPYMPEYDRAPLGFQARRGLRTRPQRALQGTLTDAFKHPPIHRPAQVTILVIQKHPLPHERIPRPPKQEQQQQQLGAEVGGERKGPSGAVAVAAEAGEQQGGGRE